MFTILVADERIGMKGWMDRSRT